MTAQPLTASPTPLVEPASAIDALPPEALAEVAAYFQMLADTTRLHILSLLRQGECNVSDLALRSGHSVANVSRHLSLMSRQGVVAREGRGTSVYYRIADDMIFSLCDLVCGNIARHLERSAPRRSVFTSGGFSERSTP